MRWKGPVDAKWLRRWTLRLGIAAWVVLAVPSLTVICLISIVGIPLGMVMLATPFLFTVVALANVVQRLLGRDGPLAVVTSLGLALLLMAGVAKYCNEGLDRRADTFLAGDLDTLEKPLRVKSIGLLRLGGRGWSRGETPCDGLCLRLLLSGAAQRVVVAALDWGVTDWTAQVPARAFRLEPRESCRPVHLVNRGFGYPVDDAEPEDAMRLAIASGRCLVEEEASLADAEAVVTTGRVQRGENEISAGLSLTADTVTADRASVHLREQGGFVERYRWTGVSVLHHPVVPVPTLAGGVELRMEPGFLRNRERRNTRDFAPDDLNPILFVRDELGLDVTIPAMAAAQSPAALIAVGLDRSGPLQPALQQVIQDFFASLRDRANSRNAQIDEATRLLAFRTLADPRVVAPRDIWALVRACAKSGDAVNAELAAILFAKLRTTDPAAREDHPSYLGYPADYLANAIATLPPNSLLAHRSEFEELARNPARRLRTHRALEQLPVFGADAVPTLLHLVDAACVLKEGSEAESSSRAKRYRDEEDWQSLYRSGLIGLCRLGGDASPALQPLMERLRNGTLPLRGANRELIVTTLVRLGVDPGQLRSHYVGEDSPIDGGRFDLLVERARTRTDCS